VVKKSFHLARGTKGFRAWMILLTCLVLLAGISTAQTSKGIIAGTVSDSTGAVVPDATVTATSIDTGETRTVTSGPTGGYRMEAVQPGSYKVVITKQGFTTLRLDNVGVRASIITPLDGILKVGASTQTVTVEAQANQINTENGEISHSISSVEVSSLPLSSLNPIQLAMTEPGVTDAGGRTATNGTSFSVNGLSARSNNFLIEGQDNNDNSIQGQAFQPINAAAISEVTVLTNSYSAEFGRGGASVTNVIYKSGTNNYHGQAWDLYQGSGLEAVTAEAGLAGQTPREKPRYDQHTFGFAAGGPIVKNKLFVYGSSQWQRFYGNATPSTIAVPTAAGAATLQALNSPNANLLLQYYGNLRSTTCPAPPATGSGCQLLSLGNDPVTGLARPSVQFGNFQRPVTAQQAPDTQWNVKVDYVPWQSDTFSVRYFHDRGSLSPDFYNFPTSLPGFDTQQGGPSENVGVAWTHMFTQNAVNEFRASWGHFDFQFAPTADTLANPLYTAPRLTIGGLSRAPLFGVSTALPQGRGHQTYQFQDATTINHGAHVFKFGFDVSRMLVRDAIPFNFFGSESFLASSASGTIPSYSGLANFVDNYSGIGNFAARTFGNPNATPRMLHEAFYLNDTWKMKPNFTLTYGLRYEFQPNPENYLSYPGYNLSAGAFTDMTQPVRVNEDTNNWGPRLGIAYTPRFAKRLLGEDKTVLRAGFGIFYDSFYTNMLDNTQASAPNAVAQLVAGTTGRGLSNAYNQVSLMTAVLNPATATQTSMSNTIINPQVYQWNANIERELPGSMLMTLSYVGTRGLHNFESDYLNPRGGWNATSLAAGSLSYLPRINPNRSTITVRTNSGDSIYHGFNAKVERRFAKGFFLRGAYTFGKVIDDGSDPYNLGDVGSAVPQNPYNRHAERGLAAQNIAQRFVVTYVYQVPGFKANSNSLMNAATYLTRNWELSGSTALQSGSPSTVYAYGIDTTGTGYASSGRPSLGNASAPITSVGIDGLWYGGTPGVLYNNDTGAVVTANDVHWVLKPGYGNVGRNTYINPGYWNFNAVITRSFKIPKLENHQLQYHLEFYNLFNHPNEDYGVNTDVTSGSGENGTFMDTYQAREGGRQIRMKLEYRF
jgi:hypothetical protein